jgi:hypothetical protein
VEQVRWDTRVIDEEMEGSQPVGVLVVGPEPRRKAMHAEVRLHAAECLFDLTATAELRRATWRRHKLNGVGFRFDQHPFGGIASVELRNSIPRLRSTALRPVFLPQCSYPLISEKA